MSLRTDVLLWAQRVLARKGGPPHLLLEISENATAQQVQDAFHQIARKSHPDLHRHGLNAEELELVTAAYAAVAGAYQQMRAMTMPTTRMRPIRLEELDRLAGASDTAPGATPRTTARPTTPPRQATPTGTLPRAVRPSAPPAPTAVRRAPTSPPAEGPAAWAPISLATAQSVNNPAEQMTPHALHYYRKAEKCLERGDLKGALLQLKLACATDPASAYLRTALAEVETEIRKAT